MSEMKNNHAMLLMISLFFFVLSGCTSSAPKITFEQMAKWQDGVFVSEFGEFSVEVPQNWKSLSDSEIRQQVNNSLLDSVIYGTPAVSVEQFEKTAGFYPMAFTTEIDNESGVITFAMVYIIIERMGALDRLRVKTADEYLEIVTEGYRQGETPDNTFSFEEIYSVNIGDFEYRCLPIIVESYQYRQVIAARIKDGFVIGFLIMTSDNHQMLTEEALSAFSSFP